MRNLLTKESVPNFERPFQTIEFKIKESKRIEKWYWRDNPVGLWLLVMSMILGFGYMAYALIETLQSVLNFSL